VTVFDDIGVAGLFDVTEGEFPVELTSFSLEKSLIFI
jgi:hypothetical protein